MQLRSSRTLPSAESPIMELLQTTSKSRPPKSPEEKHLMPHQLPNVLTPEQKRSYPSTLTLAPLSESEKDQEIARCARTGADIRKKIFNDYDAEKDRLDAELRSLQADSEKKSAEGKEERAARTGTRKRKLEEDTETPKRKLKRRRKLSGKEMKEEAPKKAKRTKNVTQSQDILMFDRGQELKQEMKFVPRFVPLPPQLMIIPAHGFEQITVLVETGTPPPSGLIPASPAYEKRDPAPPNTYHAVPRMFRIPKSYQPTCYTLVEGLHGYPLPPKGFFFPYPPKFKNGSLVRGNQIAFPVPTEFEVITSAVVPQELMFIRAPWTLPHVSFSTAQSQRNPVYRQMLTQNGLLFRCETSQEHTSSSSSYVFNKP